MRFLKQAGNQKKKNKKISAKKEKEWGKRHTHQIQIKSNKMKTETDLNK